MTTRLHHRHTPAAAAVCVFAGWPVATSGMDSMAGVPSHLSRKPMALSLRSILLATHPEEAGAP